MNKKKLRMLNVEDSEDDAELLLLHLRNSGLDIVNKRVMTASEFSAALKDEHWDFIISDYRLPGFGAPEALELLRKTDIDIPFIIISGTIGEETIVSTLKAGAHDFVTKTNMTRLVPVIERELREAELRRAKRETERRYRQIVEMSQEGIWLTDEKMKLAFVNTRMARMLGYKPHELIGRSLAEFLGEGERSAARKTLETPTQGPLGQNDYRFRCRDGTELWAIVSTTSLTGDHCEFAGVLGMVTDVTTRKRAEEERTRLLEALREAVRTRDEFLSVASHELRTPLTPLKMQLQMLLRFLSKQGLSDTDSPQLANKLRIAERQVDRLVRLIDELLDISRIDTGRLTLEKKELDLAKLVRELADHYREQAIAVKSTVVVTAEQPVVGRWDPFRIEQAVTNVLINALKFGAGQPIEITVAIQDGRALVSVTDRGIGIGKNDQERIFERFERAVPSTNFGGLGLGLYIVRQIAAAHGGSISVQSEPGRGATFILELPCQS